EPGAAGGTRGRDRHVQAGVVALQDLRGAQLVVDGRGVLVLRLLQVEVVRLERVLADHLLVRGGRRGCGTAGLAELGPAEPADRDGHVATGAADPADDVGDRRVAGHRRGAVPGRAAAAAVRGE